MRNTYPILVLIMLLLALTGSPSHAAPGDEIAPGQIRADGTEVITRTATIIANGRAVYLPIILKGATQ